MDASQSGAPLPTIGRADGVRVAIATVVAAATSLLVQLGAVRLIESEDEVTVFITFWSVLFVSFGLLTGISVETTRAVTASRRMGDARGPRVGWVGVVIAVGVAVVLSAGAAFWGPAVFPRSGTALAIVVAIGAAGFALHSVTVGSLAGTHRWRPYAWVIGVDSVLRMVLVLTAAALGWSLLGLAGGAALAAFTWLAFLLFSPSIRDAVSTRADVPLRPFARRLGAASVANGASALLTVGYPMLLSVTTPHGEYVAAAPLLLAVVLTRAPLLIPLNAFQGVAVSHVVNHQSEGIRALSRYLWMIVVVGVLGSGLAWWVGPTLLELLREGYQIQGSVLAGLTLATVGLAVLTLTGAVCQALARHGAFVAGWLTAAGVAVVLLLVPGSLEFRTVLALFVGPLAGIAVHLVALRRRTLQLAAQEIEHG